MKYLKVFDVLGPISESLPRAEA